MQVDFYKNTAGDYFANATSYIDHLKLTKVYTKGVPEIYEAWKKEDDINTYHNGEFNLSLFAGQSETSDWGCNIEDFFTKPRTGYPEAFDILCKFTLGDMKRCGMIDLGSIEVKKNPHKKEYELSFKTIGMLGAVISHLKNVNIDDMGAQPHPQTGIPFNTYLYHHFKNTSTKLAFVNQLDLDTRVGFPVYVNQNRQHGLFIGGLNQGYSVWKGLKSFMQVMGFGIRVEWDYDFISVTTDVFPCFKLILFWLSEGGNERTIKPRKNNKSYALDNANQYVLVKLGVSAPTDLFTMGIIMQNGSAWGTPDDRMYYGNTLGGTVFVIYENRLRFATGTISYTPPAGWEENISLDDVVIIEPDFHAWYFTNPSYICYASILTLTLQPALADFAGLGFIILRTAGLEYQYLIQGMKEVREIPIEFLPSDQIALHDWFTVQGKNYRIDKLSTDIISRTANIRAVQI